MNNIDRMLKVSELEEKIRVLLRCAQTCAPDKYHVLHWKIKHFVRLYKLYTGKDYDLTRHIYSDDNRGLE